MPIKTPKIIVDKYRRVRLFADATCVNSVPFSHAILDRIGLRTHACLESESKSSLKEEVSQVQKICTKNYFHIANIDADEHFECLK